MRRTQIALFSLLLVLVVPVAVASADRGEGKDGTDVLAAASVDVASAVGVTDTHATLTARVVPGVRDTTATFEYGPTTAYGSTASALPSRLPETGATTSVSIADLAPATTYHFRVVLIIGDASVPGADATFTTAATPSAQSGDGEGDDDGSNGRQDDQGHRGRGKSGDEVAPVQAPEAPVLVLPDTATPAEPRRVPGGGRPLAVPI